MAEENREDRGGLGRDGEAPPECAWSETVRKATETFGNWVRPLAATAAGFGRWLEEKFAQMAEIEKVLLADGLTQAQRKLHAGGRSVIPTQNLATLGQLIAGVAQTNEELMREMWINLLVRELSAESVHPAFVGVLQRFTPQDARRLAEIAEQTESTNQRLMVRRVIQAAQSTVLSNSVTSLLSVPTSRSKPSDLSEAVLLALNLIQIEGKCRYLTEFGKQFIEVISEPTTRTSP